MRDSINYNLKYFIMKMSGTKPMKNTMRKSPIKQTNDMAAPRPAGPKKPMNKNTVAPTMQLKKHKK